MTVEENSMKGRRTLPFLFPLNRIFEKIILSRILLLAHRVKKGDQKRGRRKTILPIYKNTLLAGFINMPRRSDQRGAKDVKKSSTVPACRLCPHLFVNMPPVWLTFAKFRCILYKDLKKNCHRRIMKNYLYIIPLALFILTLTVPGQTWDGYILGGYGESYSHGYIPGRCDFLVYKLDQAGTKLWRKNYGGSNDEVGGHIQ